MLLLGLVLAGGESRRMGMDKGTIRYHGVPQRVHAAGLLARHAESVFVSVRPDQLPALEPELVPLLDPAPDMGPMAGLLAAIGHRPDAAWLVVACDLPYLDDATLATLVAGRGPDWDAVAYAGTDNRPDPMAIVWEPTAFPAVTEAATAHRLSMRDVLKDLRVHLLPRPATDALTDVDTLQDATLRGL